MLLFDARYLRQPRSGIPRYALNLLRALRAADPGRPVRVLVPNPDALPDDLAHHAPFDAVPDPHPPRDPRDILRWPTRLKKLAPTAIHCPDAYGPLRAPVPSLVTLHDLIPLTCRAGLTKSRKQKLLPLWRAWMKLQARRAHTVVTVSQHSADDLTRLLSIPPDKIHVLYNAVPPPASPKDPATDLPSPSRIVKTLNADAPYLLCVSRLDPYKNVPGLIEAFALLNKNAQNNSRPQNQAHLVVVGPDDQRYPQAREQTKRHQLEHAVHFSGPLPDEQLDTLYQHAALLVMPSTYEGFGLPAVEAMNHGVPVVASNRTALPEVVGDAALLVDPTDPDALAAAMTNVLRDDALAKALIEKGKTRAQAFTPQRIGEQYLDLLDRTAAPPPR